MNLRLIGGITIFVLLFGLSSSILVHSAFAEEMAKKKKQAKKGQQILRNQNGSILIMDKC